MSRTALKKELSEYSKEQIIEVILDLYSSRKEIKEYLNFFLNPDSKSLFEKYKKVIIREFGKSKRNRSKARISVIKKTVRDFESFHPDPEYMHQMYRLILTLALYYEDMLYFSDTLYNGIYKIVDNYLTFADKNNELDIALSNIDQLIDSELPGSKTFKRNIAKINQAFLQRNSI